MAVIINQPKIVNNFHVVIDCMFVTTKKTIKTVATSKILVYIHIHKHKHKHIQPKIIASGISLPDAKLRKVKI